MLITFILLYYEQPKDIQYSIKSILYSNIPKDEYEIIIIDNNSTINKFNAIICEKNNINYKFFNNERLKNQSASRNIGIKNAKGKYILYIDGDDYLIPSIMYNIYTYLKNNNYLYDVIFPSAIVELRNTNTYIIKNLTNINTPTLSTYQYIVNLNFNISNNIYWEETKYYWDSEDVYYGAILLNNVKLTICYDEPYYFHPKKVGSNTDRNKNQKYKYKLYMYEMINFLLKETKNILSLKILKLLLNMIMREKI